LEAKWKEMCLILEKYKKIFPDSMEKYKKDFLWGYQLILNKGFNTIDQLVFSPIIDMIHFSKCGNINFQANLFFKMPPQQKTT